MKHQYNNSMIIQLITLIVSLVFVSSQKHGGDLIIIGGGGHGHHVEHKIIPIPYPVYHKVPVPVYHHQPHYIP